MILSYTIAATICMSVWLLLQNGRRRVCGAALGLFNALLWIFASEGAGAHGVTVVAAMCALQFACFLLAVASVAVRRAHAH